MSQGLLLFGHGARDAAWADPFRAVAAHIRVAHPSLDIELGFLEIMTPDLQSAADALVARGCRQVRVVPLFLGTGGHVRRDLPLLLERLRSTAPDRAMGVAAGDRRASGGDRGHRVGGLRCVRLTRSDWNTP